MYPLKTGTPFQGDQRAFLPAVGAAPHGYFTEVLSIISIVSRPGISLDLGAMAEDYRFLVLFVEALLLFSQPLRLRGSENLLTNAGFEEVATLDGNVPGWSVRGDNQGRPGLRDGAGHSGHFGLYLTGNTSVEQRVTGVASGAYVARCWVKSEADQSISLVLQDPDQPAVAFAYTDLKVPKDRWISLEAFCPLDRPGTFNLVIGGMSSEYRKYHGGTSEMKAPVIVDDCELTRYQATDTPTPTVWDAGKNLNSNLDWTQTAAWSVIEEPARVFAGRPVFRDRQVAGEIRLEDGAVRLYALLGQSIASRGAILPAPAFAGAKASYVKSNGQIGVHVTEAAGDRAYTAWLSPRGVIGIDPQNVAKFRIEDSELNYGLLPSFVGTDLCYNPLDLTGTREWKLPSAQWFVGLRQGGDSMLVAVCQPGSRTESLSLAGVGNTRKIQGVTFATEKAGFSVSLVEHSNLWRREALNEDWLGEYVPLGWERPFQARWMARFFVTSGGKASFRWPHMSYSFPVANAKTRIWGVWFEDWNHYPFFFEGSRLVAHFEKSFVPKGEALIYFLEPAAADLFSPTEIVEQVLGKDRAEELLDVGANQLRKLRYSTPDEFLYDRPVCATTTRLSGIKKEEKATVGVQLATHLYEFIREIRSRVDQYTAFFDELTRYLDAQDLAHPQERAYIAELRSLLAEGRARNQEIYTTPLTVVQSKIDSMKQLLRAGQGDGFDCGTLDVRGPAGAQDDLCRRNNRLVLRLIETAALQCGDSTDRAMIATHVWDVSREVLRNPTRWEPRRTLYFFEP